MLLFRFLTQVPAWVAVGIWFGFQIISGIGALGPGSQAGGVAYAAHVGGFVAGLVLGEALRHWPPHRAVADGSASRRYDRRYDS